MSIPVTLYIPEELYERIRQLAQNAQHSVESELLNFIKAATPPADQIPNLPPKTPEELGWPPGFFEATFGSIPDMEEIERERESEFEKHQKTA
jgi:hypothetical protein